MATEYQAALALRELVDSAEDVWDAYVISAIDDDDNAFKTRFAAAMDAAWEVLNG